MEKKITFTTDNKIKANTFTEGSDKTFNADGECNITVYSLDEYNKNNIKFVNYNKTNSECDGIEAFEFIEE